MSTPDSRRVPRDHVDSIVKALYAAADRLDWEHLPASARTAQYDDWVSDNEIGGVLTKYMSTENARSWIKDGPMKEYARARVGAGRYAKFGSVRGPTVAQLVSHALGPDAQVVANSEGIKPSHCLAKVDDAAIYVAWGTAKNLRHLVWATINYLAGQPEHKACVLILESLEHPTPQAEKTRHARIAKRCSIELKYYRVAGGRRQNSDGEPS